MNLMHGEYLENLPAGCHWHPNASMRDFTTFQLGGTVRGVLECSTAESLVATAKWMAAESIPYRVMGQGSNLLVADEGLDLVVLRYCDETLSSIHLHENRITVPANLLVDELARGSIAAGLGDLTFCSGIPGTVGGAIVGNAGAFGKQMGDLLESVELFNPESGERRTALRDELQFAYRTSGLKGSGELVLSATFLLEEMDPVLLQAERDRIMELRRTKHPDWRKQPCAGSVFRNVEPTSAAERRQAAGWFLEQAGAKQLEVGQAKLFEKHANIIIAHAGASAADVYQLTERMIDAVEQTFGFRLEREIQLWGFS
jgi:UDP-N-acetylmuramate dehydrogenase